jgi:acetylornithine deacetylase/succinyl-diaminopimelate desuccinylase-like protein
MTDRRIDRIAAHIARFVVCRATWRATRRVAHPVALSTALGLSALTTPGARAQAPAPHRAEERAILGEIVAINSSSGTAGVARLARTIAARLRAAGFPAADVQLLGPTPELTALVVRYRGRTPSTRPLLLMAHLDVVPALRVDWTTDPFAFVERDGWYYGRGVEDNKAGVAAIVATFVRWQRAGWRPDRDLFAVLSADEETNGASIRWLLDSVPALKTAEFALNTDAGGVALEQRRPIGVTIQASEKVFANFRLEATNAGGHSSVPRADNAIYDLAAALSRVGAYRFPARLNEVSTAFFREAAALQDSTIGPLMRAVGAQPTDSIALERLAARNDYYSSVMRTTCVATRLSGGHADNALPQRAAALVNCRMLPDDPPDSVRAALQRLAGDRVRVTSAWDAVPSPPSPLRTDVMQAVRGIAREQFGGAPVIPEMSTGATDGLFTRNAGIPTYGVGMLASEQSAPSRAHGRDERIGVEAFHAAVRTWETLVQRLAASAPVP